MFCRFIHIKEVWSFIKGNIHIQQHMCSIKQHFGRSRSEQNKNTFQTQVPFQVQMNVPGAGTGMTSAYSTAYSTGTALTGWSGRNSETVSALSSDAPVPPGHDRPLSFSPQKLSTRPPRPAQ